MAESRDETTLVTPLEEIGSRAERTFVFWLTNGSHAVNHFQNQMLVLLYAVIAADLGFGIVTVGVLVTIRGVLSSATQGLYGFATPFLPRAWLLGIGNLVLGLGTVLTGFTTSFVTLLGARTVANVGASAQHPVGNSLLAAYFPRTRGTILSVNASVSHIGDMVAPAAAGALLVILTWNQIFWAVGFLSFAMGLIYFRFGRRVEPAGESRPTSRSRLLQGKASYLRVFHNRNMLLASAVMMVGGAGRGLVVVFLGIHLIQDMGMTTWMAGVALTVLGIGGVVGPVGFGWISDRTSRTRVIQVTLFLSAAASLWVAFQSPFLPMLFLSLASYGAVTQARQPLTQAVVADSVPEADLDAAFSVFFFLGYASSIVWPLATAFIMAAFGFEVAFSVLATSYLAAMFLMLFVVDPRRVAPRQAAHA